MKKIIFVSIMICTALLTLVNCGKTSAYERGILTETSFESKFLDIKFDLPQGFVMATEEDMLQIMNIGLETMDKNKMVVDFAKLTTVYEMMASSPMGFPNVSVMVERLILSSLSTDQYLEALKANLLNVSAIDYEISDKFIEVEIAGQTYKQLSAVLSGLNVFQNYIFRKQGNRMAGFITTYTLDTGEEMDLLMSGFSKLTF